jgi:hypothetical protein
MGTPYKDTISSRSKRKRRHLLPVNQDHIRLQIVPSSKHGLFGNDAQNDDDYNDHVQQKTKQYIQQHLLKDSLFFRENPCHPVPRFSKKGSFHLQLSRSLSMCVGCSRRNLSAIRRQYKKWCWSNSHAPVATSWFCVCLPSPPKKTTTE